jgi:hypothetical protein
MEFGVSNLVRRQFPEGFGQLAPFCRQPEIGRWQKLTDLRWHFGQALFAVTANFCPGYGYLHLEVPSNLLLQLFVQAALELAHLAAPKAGHVNVVARTVALVIVPVAPQMQQVQFVYKSLFFKEIDRAVDGHEMDARIDFPRPLQNLIHVQMLLGGIHDLEDDAPLPGQPNPALADGLLQFSSGLCGIEALARRKAVRRYPAQSVNLLAFNGFGLPRFTRIGAIVHVVWMFAKT